MIYTLKELLEFPLEKRLEIILELLNVNAERE